MKRLNDKVAFITGAGSGIAKSAAIMFAAEGAKVVLAEKRLDLATMVAQEITRQGGVAIAVETDITSEESVKQAMAKTEQSFGGLDIILNCAGLSLVTDGPVTDVNMADWAPVMGVNLLGTFLCCRLGIPLLIKRGGGSIVNVSSWAALNGKLTKHIYASAKGGVVSLTRAVAGEYTKHGIRSNVICPGSIRTDRWLANRAQQPDTQELGRLEQAYPFSIGDPEDIAAIAVFLASAESRMLTGVVVPADGGRTAF